MLRSQASVQRRDPASPGPSSGDRGRGGRDRGAALAASLARPARAGVRGRLRGAGGRAARVRGLVGHRGAAPRAARRGRRRGRRGHHLAVLVRGERELDPVRAGAARVRGHRPGDAEPRRRRRRGGDDGAHDRASCRCTSSATRPTRPRWSATGCRSSRTPARRSARCTRTACRSAAAAIPPRSASTPTSSSPRARAGCSRMGSAEHKERVDSERNQGRAPGHGLARPRPARLQLPADGHRVRAGPRAAGPPGRDARRPRSRRRLVPGGAGRRRRAWSCRARTSAATCAAGSCSSSSSRAASTATTRSGRCSRAACSPSRTCPRST